MGKCDSDVLACICQYLDVLGYIVQESEITLHIRHRFDHRMSTPTLFSMTDSLMHLECAPVGAAVKCSSIYCRC